VGAPEQESSDGIMSPWISCFSYFAPLCSTGTAFLTHHRRITDGNNLTQTCLGYAITLHRDNFVKITETRRGSTGTGKFRRDYVSLDKLFFLLRSTLLHHTSSTSLHRCNGDRTATQESCTRPDIPRHYGIFEKMTGQVPVVQRRLCCG